MQPEKNELTSSARQEWDDLPEWWQQHVQNIRDLCEANGADFEDYANDIFMRHLDLIPLVYIMGQHPVLNQLYPFTSMALLCLSDTPLFEANTENFIGYTNNYPRIEALSDGNFRVLEQQATSVTWKRETRTLFVGVAQQVTDFVAAEVIRRHAK